MTYKENQKFVTALLARARAKAKSKAEEAVLRQRIKFFAQLAGLDPDDAEVEDSSNEIPAVIGEPKPMSKFAKVWLNAISRRNISAKQRRAAVMRG